MEETMSPADSLFFAPGFECSIIAILGGKTNVDPNVIKHGLQKTLVHHPRFSSIVVMDDEKGNKLSWKKTTVNLDNHVIVPNLDPNMDSPDLFVDNYISDLTRTHFPDRSKPLWELHLLNVKTSQATSTWVFKIHHSLGDGASLISLVLACTRKTSDLNELPTIPKSELRVRPSKMSGFFFTIWYIIMLFMNSIVDMTLFLGTMFFLKDSKTPLRGEHGVAKNPKVFVQRTISLDDLKLVKNAMNVTVNDVALGMTLAGLSRYLNRNFEKEELDKEMKNRRKSFLPSTRLRAAVTFNIRPTRGIEALADMMEKNSKVKWGNAIGYILLPFNIMLQDDPLDYVRQAKAFIDRKKHSLESLLTFSSTVAVLKLFGAKIAGYLAHQVLANTTFTFSNVVGPVEEISVFGYPIAYIAPSIYGHPQAFTIHLQGYANKMIIVLAADQSVIPDPCELCDYFVESFNLIKDAALIK